MARPIKNIDKHQFEALCQIQCTQEEICSVLDVDEKTLQKWCKKEYKQGFSQVFKTKRKLGHASLRKSQWDSAKGGNVTMQIWLGKQFLGQRDHVESVVAVDKVKDDKLSASLKQLAKTLESDDKQ